MVTLPEDVTVIHYYSKKKHGKKKVLGGRLREEQGTRLLY